MSNLRNLNRTLMAIFVTLLLEYNRVPRSRSSRFCNLSIGQRSRYIIKSCRQRSMIDLSTWINDRNCLRISVVDLSRKLRVNRVVWSHDATRFVFAAGNGVANVRD